MNFNKPGVLILTPFFRPNIGGVESYLSDLCEYLRKHSYMVYVLTYQPLTVKIKAKRFEADKDIEIRRVRWPGNNLFHKLEPYPVLEFIYLTPRLFIATFFFMLKNRGKIDVIHAQGLNAAFITRFTAKIFRKRAVMSTCAVYGFKKGSFFSRIVHWTLSGMDKILPLADFSRRELIDIGLPGDKLNAYYLWVDQDRYIPADKKTVREKTGLNKDWFIVLFVGRFIKIKGAQVVIQASRMCDKNIRFIFIGDQGPLLGDIEQESKRSGNVTLVKGILGHQLIPYYQAADVLVVPSQYDEAFGKVIIEALSCGTPVIGSNKGAIPDIISPEVGRVIDPTAENIKQEIEYLYRNPEVLARLTGKCRAYAEERFSEKNIDIIINSYNQ